MTVSIVGFMAHSVAHLLDKYNNSNNVYKTLFWQLIAPLFNNLYI